MIISLTKRNEQLKIEKRIARTILGTEIKEKNEIVRIKSEINIVSGIRMLQNIPNNRTNDEKWSER